MRPLLLSLLLGVALAACQKSEPAPAPATADPAEQDEAPKVDPSRKEAYVKAAVQIACAGRDIADNAKLAAEVARIQKESGFDAVSWTEMAREVAKDSGATKRISEGAARCD